MGNNLDLVHLLGLPRQVTCPICSQKVDSDFDDYDIECGDPVKGKGKFALHCYCDNCNNEFTYNCVLKIDTWGIVR